MPKIKRDKSFDWLEKQPRKQRKKVLKTYTIYTPVKETWVFTVRATCKKEALDLYQSGSDINVVQIETRTGHIYPEITVVLEK